MVGHQTLTLGILVRVQASQPKNSAPFAFYSRFFSAVPQIDSSCELLQSIYLIRRREVVRQTFCPNITDL